VAVAVAAPPAVPVSAPMLSQAIVLACGLAMREPATPAGAPSARPRSEYVESCATDSLRAATVRRARMEARDGAWNEAADLWQEALLLDDRSGADWLALGDVLLNAERNREAVAAYQRAIQLDGRLAGRGTRGAARAFARVGDDRQAIRWLELALNASQREREALLSDPDFDRYRGAVRLRGLRARDASSRRGSESRAASA